MSGPRGEHDPVNGEEETADRPRHPLTMRKVGSSPEGVELEITPTSRLDSLGRTGGLRSFEGPGTGTS